MSSSDLWYKIRPLLDPPFRIVDQRDQPDEGDSIPEHIYIVTHKGKEYRGETINEVVEQIKAGG